MANTQAHNPCTRRHANTGSTPNTNEHKHGHTHSFCVVQGQSPQPGLTVTSPPSRLSVTEAQSLALTDSSNPECSADLKPKQNLPLQSRRRFTRRAQKQEKRSQKRKRKANPFLKHTKTFKPTNTYIYHLTLTGTTMKPANHKSGAKISRPRGEVGCGSCDAAESYCSLRLSPMAEYTTLALLLFVNTV